LSTAPGHEDLQVIRSDAGVRKKRQTKRKSYDIVGLRPNENFNVFDSDINAVERAVKERMFYVKDGNGVFVSTFEPKLGTFDDKCKLFKQLFQKRVQYVAPLTKEQFLRAYDGRRRALYEKAYDSLKVRNLCRTDSEISFFMKVEKTNFSTKADPVPRGISPRSPRYHVMLGPYIKRIEKTIFTIIADVFGATTVLKGYNAQRRGEILKSHWDYFSDPVAVGIDAERFDQHVSQDALDFEHSFYLMFYHKSNLLSTLLKWQRVNKGSCYVKDGKLFFKLKGKRMSGDMNTALGNCLLMCAKIFSFMHSIGLSTNDFRLANDGDDCVLFVERKNLHKLNTLRGYSKDLGFSLKIEKPVSVFEEIEFCQAQPILTETGPVMVRNLHSIAKDCLSIKPLDNRSVYLKWIAAVAEGGLALTGQVPIFQEFYMALYRSSENAKPLKGDPTQLTGMAFLAKGMKRRYGDISSRTRVSFWRAFGISPHDQLIIEAEYRKQTIDYNTINDQYHQPFNCLITIKT
jgi:hypothetical protein